MKLVDYLKENGLTHSDFAQRIGVSQVAVSRYVGGDRIPRPAHMMAIARATGGAVKPDDFFAPFQTQTSPAPQGHLSHKRRAGKRGH